MIKELKVTYKPIKLPSDIAAAIGSNMFEGFVPTEKSLSIIVDYADGKISVDKLAEIARNRLYV